MVVYHCDDVRDMLHSVRLVGRFSRFLSCYKLYNYTKERPPNTPDKRQRYPLRAHTVTPQPARPPTP